MHIKFQVPKDCAAQADATRHCTVRSRADGQGVGLAKREVREDKNDECG
jgi:hypothetical protein